MAADVLLPFPPVGTPPHSCASTGGFVGSAPATPGTPQAPVQRHHQPRSIPTCVGLGVAPRPPPFGNEVHPHVRGARGRELREVTDGIGPSPRAWGSATSTPCWRWSGRSIPTCVGLGISIGTVSRKLKVHPHVRGARGDAAVSVGQARGPSPRAWGSAGAPVGPLGGVRSIPTCVGLGRAEPGRGPGRSVHPHVRGARFGGEVGDEGFGGPSPRAWGSGRGGPVVGLVVRSIPTCVGLGWCSRCFAAPPPVHPHVRGARATAPRSIHNPRGPSPRAWGSGQDSAPALGDRRSIPTCVGLGEVDLRFCGSLSPRYPPREQLPPAGPL
ncbi:hypothetical protein ABH917_002577 [Thermobifida halotolerans]